MIDDCAPLCASECDDVFARVRVRPTIAHGTWVEWLLDSFFADPQPHTYQLQVGHTGTNLADDWEDVGLPAVNAAYLLDDTQRVFGKTQWTHYRIKLDTPVGQYFSKPQHSWGDIPRQSWRLALSRERIWRLQFRSGKGQRGYLMKRRIVGEEAEPGQGVVDYITHEIVDPGAASTLGTQFLSGYYEPIPCVYADLSPKARHERIDPADMRATINDNLRVRATMLAVPQVDSEDVWVDEINDFRWKIHDIQHTEEIQGVPIVVNVGMRLLPFSDIVYTKEMPPQTE